MKYFYLILLHIGICKQLLTDSENVQVYHVDMKILSSDSLECNVQIEETFNYTSIEQPKKNYRLIRYLDPIIKEIENLTIFTNTVKVEDFTYQIKNNNGYKLNIYLQQLEKDFQIIYRYNIKNYLIYSPSNIKRQALNSLKLPLIQQYPYQLNLENINLQIQIHSKLLNQRNINSFGQSEFTLRNYQFQNETLTVNILITKQDLFGDIYINFPCINTNCQVKPLGLYRTMLYFILIMIYITIMII